MENISLYDLLLGYFDSDVREPSNITDSIAYFDNLDEEYKVRQSIIENLKMILQTRKGSVQHLPDFGMPDFMITYYEDRDTAPFIKQTQETILKYEPRINKVSISNKKFDPENMRLELKINAQIKDWRHREMLLTQFSATDWTMVVFEKDKK